MKEIKYEKKDTKYYIKDVPKKKIKNYISILMIVLLVLGGILILASIGKIESIGNSETGNVDYTVYLKDNDFYTNKFLRKGDSEVNNYIASLIKSFKIDFTYDSRYTDAIDYEYDYNIDAKILVTDKYDNSKVLYSKDEVLLENKSLSGKNSGYSIKETVEIDYEKYNSYVSKFKEKYSLDVESSLIVTMNITQRGTFANKQITNKVSSLNINIPLTKNTIDISVNTNQLANSFEIPIDESIIANKILFVFGVILCSSSVLLFLGILLTTKTKNDIYRKEINRLLKNYDRLIITSSQPSIDETNYKNKVRVMSFEELLDVNELTNEPIIYYEVEPDQKSYFVILKQDTLYKLTISRAYLEKQEAEKKAQAKLAKEKKED